MSNEKIIWDYFIKSGMTDEGTAGMIGNLYAESGLDPGKCEKLCLNRLAEYHLGNYTSDTYTAAIDSGKLSKEDFLHPIPPNKRYGYGLAQWTTEGRKGPLYDLCKSRGVSISDIDTQLEYLVSELKKDFQKVWKTLTTTDDIDEASDIVLLNFECPANSETMIEARRGYSKNVYTRNHEEGVKYTEVFDRRKVIDIARAEVGYLEKSASWWKKHGKEGLYYKTEGAGSDNYTKYGYEMHQLYPTVMDFPAAWCDAHVDWLFMQAYGVSNAKKLLAGDFDDYTVASAQLYKNKNAWRPGGTIPEPGWQIFFKNSIKICHTGLVLEVIQNKGKRFVVTSEGNTSSESGVVSNGGCVRIKQYPVDYDRIAGYGVPPYNDANAAAKIEFTPHWVNADGKWYYRIKENENAHGWYIINNHWYWFDERGEMATGLREISGEWYFLATKEISDEFYGACCRTESDGSVNVWDVR